MDEVRRLGALKDQEINEAKKVLAYEVTKLIHGEEEADKAQSAAEALFSGKGDMKDVPIVEVSSEIIGQQIIAVLASTKILPSKAEARRLVQQGGLTVNGEKITDINRAVNDDDFKDGSMLIKRGKKNYNKIVMK